MNTSDFSYDVHSTEATEEFFALMTRAGVQPERITAMRETREQALAAEEKQGGVKCLR